MKNERFRKIETATIEAEAKMLGAKADADAKKLQEKAIGDATNEILQEKLKLLESNSAKTLVQLEQAQNFNTANKVLIVPTNSKVIIGNEMLDCIE